MKIYWKILLLSFLLSLAACDLFQVRDPEDPSETKSSFRVPVEPKDVIQNLINAFNDKNANDYKKNFSTGLPLVNRDFFFIPSGNVLSSFPTDWYVDEEFQYFNNLIIRSPQDIPITLSFTDEQYDIRADSTIYSAKYFLNVPALNSAPKVYEGSLKFTMTTDFNDAWVIYFWEDIAKQDYKSWSELKIEFY
ncbi:MAG: hypothetical protein A2W30_00375 [Ignavibacteria bacterium RBG_16_36_9]|nr:MAG: hypothetical protein A2W30_00375 [Ignavibacteria bacterium RBG_16_36_9]